MKLLLILQFCLIAALSGCSTPHVQPPSFDGQRSFSYLETQVGFGPRVPGSPAWQRAQTYFQNHFNGLGLTVRFQDTRFFDPYSKTDKPLVNVLARAKGLDSTLPPILLVAHYDSRPRTDRHSDPTKRTDSLAGANDGASGVAVLMELANLFAAQPPAGDVELLLTDGEDWGEEGDHNFYLLGAQYFAQQGIHGKYQFGIVIDMIGDRELQVYREAYSEKYNQPLNDMVWATAGKLALTGFIDTVKYTVIDDHLPINAGGVPAIVLIDFDYDYWHTEKDLPDKCSAESLSQVGRLLAEIVYNRSLWPVRNDH